MTNLARAFIRGFSYERIERIAYTEPNWVRVKLLVSMYSERDNPRHNRTPEERLAEWLSAAKSYYTKQRLEIDTKIEFRKNSK